MASFPIRTGLIGLGVIAVCAMMASLKGHHLLLAFAGASLILAIRSWMLSRKPQAGKTAAQAPEIHARRTRSGEYQKPSGEHRVPAQVLQFPTQTWNVSDASS